MQKKEFTLNFWLFFVLIILTLVSFSATLVISWKINKTLKKEITKNKEGARPANLNLVILKDSKCKDCFDPKAALDLIKKENVKINSEKIVEITSKEGKDLISKFKIDKAPSLLVTGEIEKSDSLKTLWSKIGEIKEKTFILKQIGAPYILTSSGAVKGRASLTLLIDRNCSKCYDVTAHESILAQFGFIQTGKILDLQSKEGKDLINKYKIKLLPAIVLKGDIDAYPNLKTVWAQVGTVEKDGAYVFREGIKQMGTYMDLSLNKIVEASSSAK